MPLTPCFFRRSLWVGLIRAAAASAVFGVAAAAHAGSWVSSGGEVLGDARNPWFVTRTGTRPATVSYCVAVDEVRFSSSTTEVNAAFRKALAYWKSDFSRVRSPTLPSGEMFEIGGETFTRVPCTTEPDLVLQGGFLTPEQTERLTTASARAASLAVRTSYDPVALRGKGFLYVAPDRGRDVIVTPNAWRMGESLAIALAHELGHIFGLEHWPAPGTLQSADTVERVLEAASKGRAPALADVPSFLFGSQPSHRDPDAMCRYSTSLPALRAAFGLTKEDRCLRLEWSATRFVLQARSSDESPWRELGRARLEFAGPVEEARVTSLFLTPAQRVFRDVPRFALGVPLPGPARARPLFTGTFVPSSGPSFPISLEGGAPVPRVQAAAGGTLFVDVLQGI